MKLDLSRAQWRKSSYSGNSGNCVEVASLSCVIAVRDSKNPGGPILVMRQGQWRTFVREMKDHASGLVRGVTQRTELDYPSLPRMLK